MVSIYAIFHDKFYDMFMSDCVLHVNFREPQKCLYLLKNKKHCIAMPAFHKVLII